MEEILAELGIITAEHIKESAEKIKNANPYGHAPFPSDVTAAILAKLETLELPEGQ